MAEGGARAPGPAVRLEDFGLAIGGRTLLEDTSVVFPAERISLVVGPSGAGKSLLLGVLAGIQASDELATGGRLMIGEHDVLRQPRAADVGIVFQSFALFDEWSPVQNVRFGRDHRRGPRRAADPSVAPERLLDELGLPHGGRVSHLSGGQKQRLALARTLAFEPGVVVYDEPTSGLDPGNARRVAERIQAAQAAHATTTLIVTHDYRNLAPIAHAVFYLDPAARRLRAVAGDDLDAALAALPEHGDGDGGAAARGAATTPNPIGPTGPIVARVARAAAGRVGDVLASSSRALEAVLVAAWALLPKWRSLVWGLRYLRYYLGLVASPSSFVYFGAAGLIAGLVATHFTFEFLPYKAYTEPLITEELLQALGFSLYRILLPVLLTVLLAARGGAAIAADVGSRSYSRQLDALRSFRVRPEAYLLTNVLYALLLAAPVLVGFGFLVARFTCLAVFTYDYPEHSGLFWDVHFHRQLRLPDSAVYRGTAWVLAKVTLCGLGTGAIAFFQGLRPKGSAADVSHAITRTIIWATLFVLAVHLVFAFVEF